MTTTPPPLAPAALTPPGQTPDIVYPTVTVRFRSRVLIWLMRTFFKPLLRRMLGLKPAAIARAQLQCAAMQCTDSQGLALEYRVLAGRAPGHVLGTLATDAPVLLWLHGGAFVFPAAPNLHLPMAAKLCRDLGASGFLPDYRLAPLNRFPAPLDDCEQAYRTLLDAGHPAGQIVIGGDSAGASLLLGLLQRLRSKGLPMPACAIALSPVTEMGRVHGPAARTLRMQQDPLLPVVGMHRISELYVGDWNTADPELSPLYMASAGLPPLLFMASDNEVLRDDTVLLAGRLQAEGASVECHIWPLFPHAFPLFEPYFPEVRAAREAMVAFARHHLEQSGR